MQDHEHTQHSAHTGCQSAAQPGILLAVGACFRQAGGRDPFVEHTKTLVVNAHGALLKLQEHVRD